MQTLSAQTRLFKSLKLWSFYVDLEESIGSVETAKAVYDKILELRIANAQIIVNYAAFLEERTNTSRRASRQVLVPSMSVSDAQHRCIIGLRAGRRAFYFPHILRDMEYILVQIHQNDM